MIDFDQALLDPAKAFPNPAAIVDSDDLTRDQKIEVLLRWEYDARALSVADEENMAPVKDAAAVARPAESGKMLTQVLDALNRLDFRRDPDDAAPTKHGGA